MPLRRLASLSVGAPLFVAPPLVWGADDHTETLGLSGRFQQDNAALALSLVRIFAARTPYIPQSLLSPAAEWIASCEQLWKSSGVVRASEDHVPHTVCGKLDDGPTLPLMAMERDGLAKTKWPGRAQVCVFMCVVGIDPLKMHAYVSDARDMLSHTHTHTHVSNVRTRPYTHGICGNASLLPQFALVFA